VKVRRSELLRIAELAGFALFVAATIATIASDGPDEFIGPLALGAGWVAFVIALQTLPERIPIRAAAPYTPDEWLEDARASYARGTHISTLAVRYEVEPDWLEEQLRASAGGAR
jgi:hypothetical protein